MPTKTESTTRGRGKGKGEKEEDVELLAATVLAAAGLPAALLGGGETGRWRGGGVLAEWFQFSVYLELITVLNTFIFHVLL